MILAFLLRYCCPSYSALGQLPAGGGGRGRGGFWRDRGAGASALALRPALSPPSRRNPAARRGFPDAPRRGFRLANRLQSFFGSVPRSGSIPRPVRGRRECSLGAPYRRCGGGLTAATVVRWQRSFHLHNLLVIRPDPWVNGFVSPSPRMAAEGRERCSDAVPTRNSGGSSVSSCHDVYRSFLGHIALVIGCLSRDSSESSAV